MRAAVALLGLAAALTPLLGLAPVATAGTSAAHGLGAPTLRPGARGPDVAALQWLLSGHRPNVFTKVKPTLRVYTKGVSGPSGSRTWKALQAYKYRLGYPGIDQCTKVRPRVKWKTEAAGPYFFALLLGHRNRPECWVALAAMRTKIIARGQPTAAALHLKSFELGQVGVREPYAYERYNRYFALGPMPWCAIFQGYSMRRVGLALFGGANPWYVPAIIDWARVHGWLQARAKVGTFVAFYGSISHIGYVIGVDPAKPGGDPPGYTTVEGNWSDHVAVVHRSWGDHLRYFVWLPWLAHN